MYININRCFLFLFLSFSLVGSSQNLLWPILESDDPNFYKANCTFCEIHGGGNSFHQGIDIDCGNSNNIPFRPVANGVVVYKHNVTLRA